MTGSTAIYRHRYRQLVAEVDGGIPLEPFTVTCPQRGEVFVADLEPDDEPEDLEAIEREEQGQLKAECPTTRFCSC